MLKKKKIKIKQGQLREIKIDPGLKLYKVLADSGIIKVFRAGWKMPAEGFASVSDFEKWQHTKLLRMAREWHYKENDDVRRNMPPLQKKIRDPYYKINWDINVILRKHNLPEYYFEYVEWCLCLSQPPKDYIIEPPFPEVVMRRNPDIGRNELWVQVFGYTTKQDWDWVWEVDVERQLFHLPGYKDTMSKKEIQEYLYGKFYQPGTNADQKIKVTRKQLIAYARDRWGYSITERYLSIIFQRIKKAVKKG